MHIRIHGVRTRTLVASVDPTSLNWLVRYHDNSYDMLLVTYAPRWPNYRKKVKGWWVLESSCIWHTFSGITHCQTVTLHVWRWMLPIVVTPLQASTTKTECRQIDSYVYMTFNLIGFHTLINWTNLLETIERWGLNWFDVIILRFKWFKESQIPCQISKGRIMHVDNVVNWLTSSKAYYIPHH